MSTVYHLSNGYLFGMGVWLIGLAASLVVGVKWQRKWRSFPRRLRFVHLGLAVWPVCALLTLPELYCALFYDETDSFGLTNTSQRWYQIHVAPNAAGFRDTRPLTPNLPAGEKRLCFVGDSFTFGHGVANVEDRFSDRIAAELEAAGSLGHPGTKRYRVANTGLPGLDIRQLVDKLLPEWISNNVQIDLLVYTLVLNDIEYLDEWTAEHYQNIEQTKPEFLLFRDSYFFNLLYFRWQHLRRPEGTGYYSYLAESYKTEPWRRLQRKLDELRALCRDNGIELRVVIFPFLHNLGPDYPFRDAHRRLEAYFTGHGVKCLDLEPILAKHTGEDLTVNQFDAHPNERAHALAATAIRNHLLADLFANDGTE